MRQVQHHAAIDESSIQAIADSDNAAGFDSPSASSGAASMPEGPDGDRAADGASPARIMTPILQLLFDCAETAATRLRLYGLTFRILATKRRLGLRYHR